MVQYNDYFYGKVDIRKKITVDIDAVHTRKFSDQG